MCRQGESSETHPTLLRRARSRRANTHRMAMHDHGVDFENASFTSDEWGKDRSDGMKARLMHQGKIAFGQVVPRCGPERGIPRSSPALRHGAVAVWRRAAARPAASSDYCVCVVATSASKSRSLYIGEAAWAHFILARRCGCAARVHRSLSRGGTPTMEPEAPAPRQSRSAPPSRAAAHQAMARAMLAQE